MYYFLETNIPIKVNDIKLITGELCSALLGNINKEFIEVSFDTISKSHIKVQFVLNKKTKLEEELIDDALCEFEALHKKLLKLDCNIYKKEEKHKSLPYKVFRKFQI